MKRILQVIPCLCHGGTESYVMNHYRNMDSVQFDFFVFGSEDYPYLDEIRKRGGRIFGGVAPSVPNTVRFLKVFRKTLRENGPFSAVHCHGNAQNALALLCAAAFGIKKRVSHCHSVDPLPENPFRRAIFYIRRWLIRRCATDYLACSLEAGNALYGGSFFQAHGRIMKNGINVGNFCKTDSAYEEKLRQEFRLPSDKGLILGNISRFDSNKNQTFLLDVFSEVIKKVPSAVLLLGGVDAGTLSEIQSKAHELGLTENIRFIGERSDIPNCLGLIDVYVFPSISEGLPIGLLEAQAAGCLCIASSSITSEADMGLNALEFYNLSDGASRWAEKMLVKLRQWESPDAQTVLDAFRLHRFDIHTTSQELMDIYLE